MKGKATEYIQWKEAYAYASIKLKTHNRSYEQPVDDFYGEKPLGAGHFSYVLTFDGDDNLQIEATRDRD
jgi:hypothetical protein